MTLRRVIAGALRDRRLSLLWMERPDRNRARLGLVGATIGGAGVVAAGLGQPAAIVATPLGESLVAELWVHVLVYAGLALTSGLLLRSSHASRVYRVVIGAAIIVIGAALVEPTRALAAGVTDVPIAILVARVVFWLAISVGVALIAMRRSASSPSVRIEALAISGYGLLLIGHLVALTGDAAVDGIVAASFTRALATSVGVLEVWLLLFVAWQVVEAVHAATDMSAAWLRRTRIGGLHWMLAAKMALVVLGFALLAPDTFGDWERARIAHPFGWAYALVIAAAAITWIQRPVGRRLDRRTALRAVVGVVAAWSAPYLAGFLLIAGGLVITVLLPTGPSDMLALAMASAAAATTAAWIRSRRLPRPGLAIATAAGVATLLVAPEPSAWFRPWTSSVVAALGGVVDAITDVAIPIQAWLLILMPVFGVLALATFPRAGKLATALVAVGLWALPLAVSVYVVEVGGDASFPRVNPNLLMLDVALTLAALVHLVRYRYRRSGATSPHAATIGILVGVTTTVAHGRQLVEPLAGWFTTTVAGWFDLDAAALGFVALLVVPALFGVFLDARELNLERSPSDVLKAIGVSCLVFTIAVAVIAVGRGASDDGAEGLVRTIVFGLVLLSGMTRFDPVTHAPAVD